MKCIGNAECASAEHAAAVTVPYQTQVSSSSFSFIHSESFLILDRICLCSAFIDSTKDANLAEKLTPSGPAMEIDTWQLKPNDIQKYHKFCSVLSPSPKQDIKEDDVGGAGHGLLPAAPKIQQAHFEPYVELSRMWPGLS